MHFDPFLSVLEQKNLRFTTMDLLSYPLDFCSALLSVDGAPLVRPTKSDPATECKNAIFAEKRQLKLLLFLQLHQQTSETDTNLLQTFLINAHPILMCIISSK